MTQKDIKGSDSSGSAEQSRRLKEQSRRLKAACMAQERFTWRRSLQVSDRCIIKFIFGSTKSVVVSEKHSQSSVTEYYLLLRQKYLRLGKRLLTHILRKNTNSVTGSLRIIDMLQ